MDAIRVPKNLFAAISLARTLDLLGLHRDACRVDNIIATTHFRRPIYPDELASIWNCLPKDSKYIYGTIKMLGDRLRREEQSNVKAFSEGVLEILKDNPELEARVQDPEINKRYEPVFGREWCQYVGPNELPTKKSRGAMQNAHIGTHQVEEKENLFELDHKHPIETHKETSVDAEQVKQFNTEKKKFNILRIVPPKPQEANADKVGSEVLPQGNGKAMQTEL
jgi:hypothetical protein